MNHEILSLLREILDLTRAQAGLMESPELDGMEENLTARKECLRKLGLLTESAKDGLRSKEITALVSEIREQEAYNENRLKGLMSHLEEKMQKTTDGRRAVLHYDGIGVFDSSFDRLK